MTCCAGPIAADLTLYRQGAQRIALGEELQRNSAKLPNGHEAITLSVPAIHCGNCVATIERNVAKIPGVDSVRANLTLRRATVTFDRALVSPLIVTDALEHLGYEVRPLSGEETGQRDPQLKTLIRATAVTGFASANVMLLSVCVWNGAEGATRDLFHLVSALIAVPAIAAGGLPFFKSALRALSNKRTNMDVPISLGVLLATGMSLHESMAGGAHAYFDAAVSLLFFLLIGRTLDYMMRSKACAAAERLAQLSAKGGFVVGDDGEVRYLPLHALAPGMTVQVSAGERFPVDGTITSGESDADCSLVTGESEPIRLTLGTRVEAGALNLTGPVDMLAMRAAKDSFLAEVTEMMAAAERGRGSYERIADRMARIYAPAVHILALATLSGWMAATQGNWHQSITAAVAVLIITCPCALGLAVPVAHVVAAGRLFAGGILLKDGSGLERLSSVTDVVFDKTGTLTTGTPSIEDCSIPPGNHRAIAKALAQRSVHPAARSLARFIVETPASGLQDLREVPGHGVEATLQTTRVRLGRSSWVAELAGPETASAGAGVAFAIEGSRLYSITLSESLRPGARAAVTYLKNRGLASSILSGDGEERVSRIAVEVGIEEFHANLKPGEKLERLQDMAKSGKRVLMVGDGLNDAPALAAAHVSIAPANGSDAGRTAADFVFTRDTLECVSFAHEAAVKTARIVRQNFGLAILYNVCAVPLAMSGQLNPLIAAVAMSTSSIIVVANSLRLYRLNIARQKPEPDSLTATPTLVEAGA